MDMYDYSIPDIGVATRHTWRTLKMNDLKDKIYDVATITTKQNATKGMHVLSDIMYTLKWKAIRRQAII